MRVMVLRLADADTEAGVLPKADLLAAMGAYMESLGKAGVLVDGEGLKPTSAGKRVIFKGGEPTVVDGPFTESKDLLAGYAVLKVASMEEAVAHVKRWPKEDGNVRLEIRPFFEAEDFGEEFSPEMREREDRLRAEIEAKNAADRNAAGGR